MCMFTAHRRSQLWPNGHQVLRTGEGCTHYHHEAEQGCARKMPLRGLRGEEQDVDLMHTVVHRETWDVHDLSPREASSDEHDRVNVFITKQTVNTDYEGGRLQQSRRPLDMEF